MLIPKRRVCVFTDGPMSQNVQQLFYRVIVDGMMTREIIQYFGTNADSHTLAQHGMVLEEVE